MAVEILCGGLLIAWETTILKKPDPSQKGLERCLEFGERKMNKWLEMKQEQVPYKADNCGEANKFPLCKYRIFLSKI